MHLWVHAQTVRIGDCRFFIINSFSCVFSFCFRINNTSAAAAAMEVSNGSNQSDADACSLSAQWLTYPFTYLSLYVSGVLICTIICTVGWLLNWKGLLHHLAFLTKLKQVSRQFSSGDNLISQVLISAMLLCNLTYMGLAIQRAYQPEIRCFTSLAKVPDLAVELIVSPPLIIFFFIRLLAADNLLLFWVKLHNIVDVVTLPNVYVALSLGQDWRDTKSLRFIWLTQFTDILRFLPFMRSQDTIDVVSLVVRLVALWLAATGLIHVLESTGDPWKDYTNQQSVTFLEYAYFTVVTMSTVGYGDYFAKTDIGKIFMTFFIITGISFFAFALPTLVEIIIDYYHRTQWSHFDTTRVPRHVLVCGHITAATVADFLNNFLHTDRGDRKTHVLFMHTERPGNDLRKILRSYCTRVQYVVGSVLRSDDLAKVKIRECAVVFILAEKHGDCPEREDRENLLRLVAIKNTFTNIPVVIQVLLVSSAAQMSNIPHTESDTVVCLNELKLGLLAQSCLCPGLSTLISNLFKARGAALNTGQGWQSLYQQGVSYEVYLSHFSSAFEEMTFYEAAQCCYEKLGLILLAIEDRSSGQLYISPSPQGSHHLRLRASDPSRPETSMLGYFIGEDQTDVDRVSWFEETQDKVHSILSISFLPHRHSPSDKRKLSEFSFNCSLQSRTLSLSLRLKSNYLHQLDTPPSMDQCILNSDSPPLTNHILLCIFSDNSSSPLYLCNFLKPLRRKTIACKQLMPVVVISQRKFLEKEWPCISAFSDVFLVPGCPLQMETLSRAQVESCQVCVVLTASMQGELKDPLMRDKDAILCSLMIHNYFRQCSAVTSSPPLIICDLIDESNVQFLDIEDEDNDDGLTFSSQPFACGEAFASSLFDSITSSIYRSPGALFLVKQLITASQSDSCPTLSQVRSIPLSQLHKPASWLTFGQLYSAMLTQHKTCLAVSRLLNHSPSENDDVVVDTAVPVVPSRQQNQDSQRYIVTAPPANTRLCPSDHILVLEEWLED